MTGKKRILVVDDEQSISKTLKLLLETRGYDVDVAETGREALEKALKKPDIILLDLVLPDIPGFDVCRKLRENKTTRLIPIIILSVRYLYEDKVEGLYLGADDYITKPFEYEELFARVEAVIRRRQMFDDTEKENSPVIVELRRIIDEKLITPFFQPIYLLKPFKLYGLEVLSRPPMQSILSNPEMLFEAALRFGFYKELEMTCWKKAFEVLSSGSYSNRIFLNCNPYLVESAEFLTIKSLISDYNISSKDVVLEITERSGITDYRMFFDRLREYQKDGLCVAIDDVGGGYASFESIVEISPNLVKIDISIIRDLDKNPLKASVVKFIIGFCKENNIISVAEGIERKEELDVLLDLGVDAGQGYFLGMPSPEIKVDELNQKKIA
ncbi:MAG: EAL domain-containing protein [Candidatus Omnitrophica bacterium]|nr:EAL domain-containing protein [Candidatus Omnitrophota bacterium]